LVKTNIGIQRGRSFADCENNMPNMAETIGREGKSNWQSTKESLVMRETIEKGKKEALIKEGGRLELGITK
jgi:hypothetical protein